MTSVRLSNSTTFYHKFLGPVLILVFAAAPLRDCFNPASDLPVFVNLLFVAAILGVATYATYLGHSLKVVSLEGDALRISNFFTSETIPASEVESVRIRRHGFLEIVEMSIPRGTKFGQTIRFMSVLRWPMAEVHPVVSLLHLEADSDTGSEVS